MKITVRPLLPVLLCAFWLPLAGCQESPPASTFPAPATPAAATWPVQRKTDSGNFTVTIRPDAGAITRNQHFALEVLVEPGAGAAAVSSVAVDADMPSHGHGMNTKPETTSEGGNRYRAKGMLFHMAGDWSIVVDITAGAGRERVFFPVSIE